MALWFCAVLRRLCTAMAAGWMMLGCVGWFGGGGLAAAEPGGGMDEPLTYEQHVRPILRAHCLDCHGAQPQLKGGLDLRLRRLMLQGGASGEAIVPGDAQASRLVQRMWRGEMPPGDVPVSDEEIRVIARWIDSGAATARPEPDELGPGLGITPEERLFWSFQPVRRPEISNPPHPSVRTPIDSLLLAAMHQRDPQLDFSPDADRRTLIRRLSSSLLGLPPGPEEVEAFVADESPGAYERLVDRLLDSPHYGERWARHWLDAAGFADSEGYTTADALRPDAYKYRDYVIRSLNADKPLDEFIIEQLAGDELVEPPYANLTDESIERLTATGFLRMAADGTGSGANTFEARNQTIADTIHIVSTSLLGLTVSCAQCHDHRYDPISHVDYHRLRAVFEPAYNEQHWRTPAERRLSLYTDEDREAAAAIEAEAQQAEAERREKQQRFLLEALEQELQRFDPPLRAALREAYETPAGERSEEQQRLLSEHPSVNITPGVLYQYNQAAADELARDAQQIAAIRARKPVEEFLRVLMEVPGQLPESHVFHRGDPQQRTEPVEPGGLAITAAEGQRLRLAVNDPALPSTGRRLAYARWLTSGQHPLVARVLANRVWMHHFGRGIVGTPGDFGQLGDRPTHPELLDWLAAELIESGWSLKHLHRVIVTSTAYRQSSATDPRRESIDPVNELYWRASLRRLDAESLRDHMLAVTGRLAPQLFGPPAAVEADETGQIVVASDMARRSIYIQARRSQPVALLASFDAPVMEVNCTQRPTSTVATQSLMLMNNRFILDQASHFAARLAGEISWPAADATDPNRDWSGAIERAWRLAYQRPPDDGERELARDFLERQSAQLAGRDGIDATTQALTNLCQALLSSNEFLYLD